MSATPGPWRLLPPRNRNYRDAVRGRDYEATAQRCYYLAGPDSESHFVADIVVDGIFEIGEANANLIAAAPKLLAACKEAVREAECAVNPLTRLPNYSQMICAIAMAERKGRQAAQPTTTKGGDCRP